jgi:hypothetical protein
MIAAGYEDCDDVDTLRFDPALKIAVGRAPESGGDLMSQPTLSRLENLAEWRALARIGLGKIDLYCRSFARPPAAIVLDIDDTDDPVHGQQELALFNAHYDCACFQPIHIFDGLSGDDLRRAVDRSLRVVALDETVRGGTRHGPAELRVARLCGKEEAHEA